MRAEVPFKERRRNWRKRVGELRVMRDAAEGTPRFWKVVKQITRLEIKLGRTAL